MLRTWSSIVTTDVSHEVNWDALLAAAEGGEDLHAFRLPSVSLSDVLIQLGLEQLCESRDFSRLLQALGGSSTPKEWSSVITTTRSHQVNRNALLASAEVGEDLSGLRLPSVSVLDVLVQHGLEQRLKTRDLSPLLRALGISSTQLTWDDVLRTTDKLCYMGMVPLGYGTTWNGHRMGKDLDIAKRLRIEGASPSAPWVEEVATSSVPDALPVSEDTDDESLVDVEIIHQLSVPGTDSSAGYPEYAYSNAL